MIISDLNFHMSPVLVIGSASKSVSWENFVKLFFFNLFVPTTEIHVRGTCKCGYWDQTKFPRRKVWWLREPSKIGENVHTPTCMWKNILATRSRHYTLLLLPTWSLQECKFKFMRTCLLPILLLDINPLMVLSFKTFQNLLTGKMAINMSEPFKTLHNFLLLHYHTFQYPLKGFER